MGSTACQIVRNTAMNLVKACFSVLLMGAVCFGAPSTDGGNEILSREKRTLGLVSAGAGAAASGLTTAGKLAAAGIAIVSAVKPLIMLGVGKYFLYNWLQKRQKKLNPQEKKVNKILSNQNAREISKSRAITAINSQVEANIFIPIIISDRSS